MGGSFLNIDSKCDPGSTYLCLLTDVGDRFAAGAAEQPVAEAHPLTGEVCRARGDAEQRQQAAHLEA